MIDNLLEIIEAYGHYERVFTRVLRFLKEDLIGKINTFPLINVHFFHLVVSSLISGSIRTILRIIYCL